MSDMELVCQDCGSTDDVRETLCPFALEISERKVEIVICSECYSERVQDI